jgi:hypothetical protein
MTYRLSALLWEATSAVVNDLDILAAPESIRRELYVEAVVMIQYEKGTKTVEGI